MKHQRERDQGQSAAPLGGRARWSAAEGAAMLEELAASGESDAGYSRRTGVASHRIQYWRKRLGAEPLARSMAGTGGFVPVLVVDEPEQTMDRRQVEVTLRTGATMVFRGDWNAVSLRPWMAVLGGDHAE